MYMAEYTLYIDESETFNNTGNKYFVMSGVIIKNSNYSEIENKLNQIKKKYGIMHKDAKKIYYMKKILTLRIFV